MAEKKIIELEVKNNLGSLKSQLREAQAEVAKLSEQFGVTSKEAANAAKRAAELKDQIEDAKALTDAFNPDAKFKALSSSLSGVAGGFAAVQGGMALFGSESENVEKTLLKVQSAMALSQGLQTIGESVDSFKQLGAVFKSNVAVQKVLTVSQAAYTTVVGASTGALKLLRIALAATGIGAIVVGLGLLIANFDKVKKAVLNLIPGLAQVGEFFGNIVESVTDFVGATSEAERALDSLKDAADKTLSVNKKFLAEHGDQVDKYTKQKIDAKNAYAAAIKEEGANTAALAKRLNRELAAIDKQREDDRIKINQDAADKIKAANEKLAAAKKAADEKAASIEKARFKTQQEIRDQDLKNQEQLDAEKKERDALKATAADQKVTADLARMSKGLNDERDLITASNVEQLANAKADAAAKLTVQTEFRNAIAASLGAISQLFEQGTAASKIAALAEIAIGTGTGFINALVIAQKSASATGPAAAFAFPVFYATQLAAVLGAASKAKNILKQVKGGGGGSGGVSAPANPAISAAAPDAPQFNVVGTSGVNQIAQGLGNQSPVQAYVVGSQVTTQQALDRNIVRTATLGG